MLNAELLPLRDDRAVLRPMRAEDADAYAAGTTDPAVYLYAHLPEPEYTPASVTELIRGTLKEGLHRGDLAVLTIAEPATDAFAGSLVLFGVSDNSAEVGFWVHPDHRGKGLSAAALQLGSAFARRSGITRLTARTVPENQASQRILERAGFTQGECGRGMAPSGEEADLLHYFCSIEPISLLPVETERLRLRLHQHGDADALQRIYEQKEVARYLLEEPWSRSEAERRISQRIGQTGLHHGSEALSLVIEQDGALIGDVLLWLTDTEHRIAEIGWVMNPAYGGQGLATEAVQAVLELGFEHYGLHRVAAQMDARNTASVRLSERVGLQREAHLRQDWWSKGEWTDTLIYGSLSADCESDVAP